MSTILIVFHCCCFSFIHSYRHGLSTAPCSRSGCQAYSSRKAFSLVRFRCMQESTICPSMSSRSSSLCCKTTAIRASTTRPSRISSTANRSTRTNKYLNRKNEHHPSITVTQRTNSVPNATLFKLNVPKDGVLIHGLFMDAFRWDDQAMRCTESHIGEMTSPLPMLHMEPKRNLVQNPKHYMSPLYRTAARAGTLSTTGKHRLKRVSFSALI